MNNLKNSIFSEVKARKVADILDLRQSKDSLLFFSQEKNHLIQKYVGPSFHLYSEEAKNVRFNKFFLTSWLDEPRISLRTLEKGIKSFFYLLEDFSLGLFENVHESNLENVIKILENLSNGYVLTFLNDEGNYYCLFQVRKYGL